MKHSVIIAVIFIFLRFNSGDAVVPTTNVEPRQYTATVGDASFQIQCLVTAILGATSWYWTFQPVGGSQQTIAQGTNDNQYTVDNSATNPHLTIKSIALNEAGIYTCYATNAVGTSDSSNSPSSRHTLTVAGAILTVTISPATANVIRGNTQTIDCNPQGNPAATQITWYFTPSGSRSQQLLNIVNSGRKYNGGTPGNPDLTITDFQTNNAGSYRCAATNAAGTGVSSHSVLTYVDPLSISVTPADGSAIYGDASYTIQCTITGTIPTSCSWSKRPVAGGVVSPISAGGKYIIANSANAPHLTINNVVEDDEQDYFCQATNAAGTVTSSRARLTVNGGLLSVAISPSNADVLQGQSQLISCTVTGTPSATYFSWRFTPSGSSQQQTLSLGNTAKYSGGTIQNPTLTVLNFQSSDGGSYVCSATNAVGTSSSTTSVLRYIQQLTISVSPSDGAAIYGDSSYTIQCSITGTPQTTSWSWVRMPISGGTETPISTGSKYSIVNSATAPHLTINNVVEEDELDYYCRATNVAGTQTSTRARLIVYGGALTVTIPSSTYSVLLGNQISITCTVSGSPSATNVYWMKQQTNGGSFSNVNISGNNRYSGGTLSSPTLVITSAQLSDEGNYRCHGTNAAGDTNSIVTNLDVTGINGGWSSWIFGACNVTCGTGQQSRRRYCNNPLQANGGADCQGEEDDIISCTRSECAKQQSENMPIVVGTVISVLVIGILILGLVIYAKRRWHNSKKELDYEITDMTKDKAHTYGETHANHAYQNDQHTAEIEVTAMDNC